DQLFDRHLLGEAVEDRARSRPGRRQGEGVGPEVTGDGALAAARRADEQADVPGPLVQGQVDVPRHGGGGRGLEVEDPSYLGNSWAFLDRAFDDDVGLHRW